MELHGIRDHRRFSEHLLAGLHRLAPGDYVSYNEIELSRGSSVWAVHRPSSEVAVALLGVFARLAAEHPVIAAWRLSKAPPAALRWSDVTSAGALRRLPLYNEYFRPLGIRHQLTVPLSTSADVVVCLACNRSGSDFTDRERRVAEAIRPHAAQALQNIRTFTRLREALAAGDRIDSPPARGTIPVRRRRTRLQAWSNFGLTEREVQVLQWIARGKSNAAIGDILGIKQRTVAKHLEHIFLGLDVDSRTAAAAKACRVMRNLTDDRDGSEP